MRSKGPLLSEKRGVKFISYLTIPAKKELVIRKFIVTSSTFSSLEGRVCTGANSARVHDR